MYWSRCQYLEAKPPQTKQGNLFSCHSPNGLHSSTQGKIKVMILEMPPYTIFWFKMQIGSAKLIVLPYLSDSYCCFAIDSRLVEGLLVVMA